MLTLSGIISLAIFATSMFTDDVASGLIVALVTLVIGLLLSHARRDIERFDSIEKRFDDLDREITKLTAILPYLSGRKKYLKKDR